jgi:hypothetical protein
VKARLPYNQLSRAHKRGYEPRPVTVEEARRWSQIHGSEQELLARTWLRRIVFWRPEPERQGLSNDQP